MVQWINVQMKSFFKSDTITSFVVGKTVAVALVQLGLMAGRQQIYCY